MKKWERMVIAAALAALAVLPIAAFILLRDDSGDSPKVQHGCNAEERKVEARLAARPTPTPLGPNLDVEELNRQGREAVTNPYAGMLCGFEIVASEDEARPQTYCRGTVTGRGGESPLPFLDSELNKPGMTEQGVCNGAEVFATYGLARRTYFRAAPKLNFVANRDYLRVVNVDDHEVLLRLSSPLGPVFVAAVQRWPEGDKPGILIALMAGDTDDAIRHVRRALAE